MRWDQMRASLENPNAGVAVSIDTGDRDDVHPTDKKAIVDRLAAIALHDVYGRKDLAVYGPVFKSAKYSGDTAEIEFDLRGRKLECSGAPRGFLAKGKDGYYLASDVTALLPFAKTGIAAQLRKAGALVSEEYVPEGLLIHARVEPREMALVKPYIVENNSESENV